MLYTRMPIGQFYLRNRTSCKLLCMFTTILAVCFTYVYTDKWRMPLNHPNDAIRMVQTLNTSRAFKGRQDKNMPPCTLGLLRDKFLQEGLFSADISWHTTKKGKSVSYDLVPHWCTFTHIRPRMATCLKKKNVSKIAVLGDSNGFRYTTALLEQLKPCKRVKTETALTQDKRRIPDKNYFVPNPRLLRTNGGACRKCLSTVHQCEGGGHKMAVEYITMEYTIDTQITSDWYNLLLHVSPYILLTCTTSTCMSSMSA